ncbi:MAG: 4-hydroxythreonine-4-phosphate dehydrogenase, partial [Prevotella sp.]|nr:4-hydroxythreonine-4-phosphate dehydrogenase [Prevotella sp.]
DSEIAGKGEADEESFRHAIFFAIDVFRNRANYDEPLADPLPKLYHEKKEEGERPRLPFPKKKMEVQEDKSEQEA